MIGDKYVFTQTHEDKANIILPNIVNLFKSNGRLLVGIAGISGTGKCIVGDSYVIGNTGLVEIENYDLNDKIVNGNNVLESPIYYFNQTVENTIKIVTGRGYSLEGTANHPILVWDKKSCDFYFKKLEEINEDDIIVIDRGIKNHNRQSPIIDFESDAFKVPDKITPDLARFLGYFVANGGFIKNSIRISTYNSLLVDDIDNILKPLNLVIKRYKNGDNQVLSSSFNKFIFNLCDSPSKFTARYKYIPSIILKSPIEIQKNFIKGLLDSDSYLSKECGVIEYSTASEKLAKQVHLILLNCGMVSRLYIKRVKGYDWNYWNLEISSINLDIYFSLINSLKYTNFIPKKRNVNLDVIYGLLEYIRLKNKAFELGIAHNCLSLQKTIRKNITYQSLDRIIKYLRSIKERCPLSFLNKLENIAEKHYYLDTIKSIKINKDKKIVYDYELSTHSFWSNGFISHNSEISLTLQEDLWEKYKIRTKIIHLDDYYKIPPISREKHRKDTDIVGREEIDWKKIENIIHSFKENRRYIRVQRIHKYLDDYEFCITPCKDIDVIIFEGLFSLYIQELNYKCYLNGSPEDTWKFRVKRGKENPHDEFRKYVVQREANCVVQSKKYADIIVPFNIEKEEK